MNIDPTRELREVAAKLTTPKFRLVDKRPLELTVEANPPALHPIEILAALAAKLRYLASQLEGYERIDRENRRGPPSNKRGAQYAIANVKSITQLMYEAGQLVEQIPDDPYARQTLEVLAMACDANCQSEMFAECLMMNGQKNEAIAGIAGGPGA